MDYFIITAIIITVIAIASIYIAFFYKKPEHTSTRPLPEINSAIDIPQEDQDYLAPIVVSVLKHLAVSKKNYPTNAMLIDHLSETLGQAASSFKQRTKENPVVQKKNEDWLGVAAMAIRLYDEGTPHNSNSAREQMVTLGVLSRRELDIWARQVNEEIISLVKKGMGMKKGVQHMQQHAQTVAGSPYTADEIEDLKQAHQLKLMKKGKSK